MVFAKRARPILRSWCDCLGKTVPFGFRRDTVSAVSKNYQVAFAFQGRNEQVMIEVT